MKYATLTLLASLIALAPVNATTEQPDSDGVWKSESPDGSYFCAMRRMATDDYIWKEELDGFRLVVFPIEEQKTPKTLGELYFTFDEGERLPAIFISSNISDEVFEVDFQFGKRDGRRFLSSLTLFYNSKYYSMDLSVLPELPWASTMIFKTESGVAFVLNAGGGEHVNYCVFEIELKTMDLVRSSWSHLNLGQVGKTTRMHLVEKKEP